MLGSNISIAQIPLTITDYALYAYFPEEQKITFIELYYKNDKDLENRNRILIYFS